MKKLLRIVLFCCLAAAGAAYAATSLITEGAAGDAEGRTRNISQGVPAHVDAPRPVPLYRVASERAAVSRAYPGTAGAVNEVALSFRVAGPLVAVDVGPGTVVRKGQPLMRIDPRDFKDDISVIEAQLAGAGAEFKDVRVDLERLKPLIKKNVVSQSDYDQAESVHDMTAAKVKNIEARLRIARHRLEDTTLRAPFDGIVTAQLVENHEMVAAGQLALKMHDASKIEIHVNIPENELCRYDLRKKHEVDVSFPAIQSRVYRARLREWSAQADPVTRTYKVTFRLPAPPPSEGVTILPGMTAEVSWKAPRNNASSIFIPASAVSSDGKGRSVVWVFDAAEGKAAPRVVETGELRDGSRLNVLGGLREGETIVAAGVDFITPDMKLRPLESRKQ